MQLGTLDKKAYKALTAYRDQKVKMVFLVMMVSLGLKESLAFLDLMVPEDILDLLGLMGCQVK